MDELLLGVFSPTLRWDVHNCTFDDFQQGFLYALTCAIALDESLILEAEDCVVDVETMGELTRGYLSVSHAILPDIEIADPALKRRPPNARVIKKIDQAGFFAAMKQTLL